jgi:hypothetical protein
MFGDIKYSTRVRKSGVAASLATAVQNRVRFVTNLSNGNPARFRIVTFV